MSHEYQPNKLWIDGFCRTQPDDNIQKFCEKFGTFIHMYRPRNGNYVFLTYESAEEATVAMKKFKSERFTCRYATKKPALSETSSTLEPTGQLDSSNASSSQVSPRRVHFSGDSASRSSNSAPAPGGTVYRNGDKIIITHVRDEHLFYARPVSRDQEYEEMLKTISQLAKKMGPFRGVPNQKMVLMTPFKNDYYRGLVLDEAKSADESVTVRLVDIGLTIEIPIRELKPMPREYIHVRITYPFQLEGVEDASIDSYAAKCLQSYTGKRLLLDFDGEIAEPRSQVRLIDPLTKRNINELIKGMNRSFVAEEMIRNPAPIGNNRKLITVDESKLRDGFNIITFIDSKDSSDFKKQNDQIQAVGHELEDYPPFKPKKEADLCLVKYQGLWHRGIFVDRNENTRLIVVLLIDIGKAVEVDSKDIRNIIEELVRVPVFSFIAAINSYPKEISNAKVGNIIHKFKANDLICIESICEGFDKGIYLIDI